MEANINSPSSVRIRKLEPWIIQTHTNLARNAGTSLEEYLRALLKNQALKAQEDFADEIDQIRTEMADSLKAERPSSEAIIRDIRDESC